MFAVRWIARPGGAFAVMALAGLIWRTRRRPRRRCAWQGASQSVRLHPGRRRRRNRHLQETRHRPRHQFVCRDSCCSHAARRITTRSARSPAVTRAPRSNEAKVAVPALAAPVLSVPIEMSEPGGIAFALAWTSPAPKAPDLQYNVYRATTPGGEGATPYATGLTGNIAEPLSAPFGSSYYYQVSAVVGGVESPRSNEVHVAAPFPGTTVGGVHAAGFPITATVGQAVTVPVAEFIPRTVKTSLNVTALELSKAQKAKPVSLSVSTPIRRFVARIRSGRWQDFPWRRDQLEWPDHGLRYAHVPETGVAEGQGRHP